MIINESKTKVASLIGLGAAASTLIALQLNRNLIDWKSVSFFSSIGCILTANHLDSAEGYSFVSKLTGGWL